MPVIFVPTPIGNRDDITLRAIDALKSADVIACEDTRHSAPLLAHLGIHKPLMSLHEHNEAHRAEEIATRANQGENFAVISDAGMPGVSDPGYRLIQVLKQKQVMFSVLPGPSAVLTALIGSGFPSDAFFFGGFLSVKKGKRQSVFQNALAQSFTSLFFESPHRLLSSLKILAELDPEAPICVARELTKTFETFHHGTARFLFEEFSAKKPKGEIVLLVGGINCPRSPGTDCEKQPMP